jgi:hypothetical protein
MPRLAAIGHSATTVTMWRLGGSIREVPVVDVPKHQTEGWRFADRQELDRYRRAAHKDQPEMWAQRSTDDLRELFLVDRLAAIRRVEAAQAEYQSWIPESVRA